MPDSPLRKWSDVSPGFFFLTSPYPHKCSASKPVPKQVFKDVSEVMGRPFLLTDDMRRKIVNAGFQNTEEYVLKAPLGSWPADRRLKDIGSWTDYAFSTGLEGWGMQVLTKYLDVSVLIL